jgi:hypothetical protein
MRVMQLCTCEGALVQQLAGDTRFAIEMCMEGLSVCRGLPGFAGARGVRQTSGDGQRQDLLVEKLAR